MELVRELVDVGIDISQLRVDYFQTRKALLNVTEEFVCLEEQLENLSEQHLALVTCC